MSSHFQECLSAQVTPVKMEAAVKIKAMDISVPVRLGTQERTVRQVSIPVFVCLGTPVLIVRQVSTSVPVNLGTLALVVRSQ